MILATCGSNLSDSFSEMSGKGDGAVPPSKVPKTASRFNVLSIHKQWLLHVYKANGLKSQQVFHTTARLRNLFGQALMS